MPRKNGISRDKILAAALELVDKNGIDALTIQNLARHLGIKAPSLYNHIQGLDDLKRRASTLVNLQIIEVIDRATKGKSGKDAVRSLAEAYRHFALRYPGRYVLSVVFPSKKSKDWSTTFFALRDIFGKVIRGERSLQDDKVFSAARMLRSLLHGFIDLEFRGGWSQVVDVDTSFAMGIEVFCNGLKIK
jgi:AcrR family transcriptional regulator